MTIRRSAPRECDHPELAPVWPGDTQPRLKTYPRLSFVDQTALLSRGIAGNIRAALATPERPQLPARAARKTRANTTT